MLCAMPWPSGLREVVAYYKFEVHGLCSKCIKMINRTVINPNLLMEPVDPVDRIVNPLERLVELNENSAIVKNIELCTFSLVVVLILSILLYIQ
jgi:hypothetical protein